MVLLKGPCDDLEIALEFVDDLIRKPSDLDEVKRAYLEQRA